MGVTIGATQPVCMDGISEFDWRKNRGIVGCFREEEEEVVIKFEKMVEVARVELVIQFRNDSLKIKPVL